MKKRFIGLALILILMLPAGGYAGVPLDTLQGHINSVLDVLRDKTLKGDSATETRRKKIQVISKKMFNYPELSMRTLGQDWKKLTDKEKTEFTDLFSELLENVYMNRILEYSDEKVDFRNEKTLAEDKAEVQTFIVTKTKEIPINYRMLLDKGSWGIYDVIIEGVSLINNYRTQFKKILTNKPPEELINVLREKVHGGEKGDAKKKKG